MKLEERQLPRAQYSSRTTIARKKININFNRNREVINVRIYLFAVEKCQMGWTRKLGEGMAKKLELKSLIYTIVRWGERNIQRERVEAKKKVLLLNASKQWTRSADFLFFFLLGSCFWERMRSSEILSFPIIPWKSCWTTCFSAFIIHGWIIDKKWLISENLIFVLLWKLLGSWGSESRWGNPERTTGFPSSEIQFSQCNFGGNEILVGTSLTSSRSFTIEGDFLHFDSVFGVRISSRGNQNIKSKTLQQKSFEIVKKFELKFKQ